MQQRFACLVLLIGTVSGSQAQNVNIPPPSNWTIEGYGVSAFFSQREAGSLILRGTCTRTTDGDDVTTEEISAPDPATFKNLGEAFDYLSQVNQHIAWSRQANDLVEVKDDRASADILRLPIKEFRLKDALTIQDAVDKVLLAPEIKLYADQHRLKLLTSYRSVDIWNEEIIRRLSESANAPRYSQVFTDTSLKAILDSVVHIYSGVWEYQECEGRITITTDPTRLRRKTDNPTH